MTKAETQAAAPLQARNAPASATAASSRRLVVLVSGVFHAAYDDVLGEFEKQNEIKICSELSPSMGDSDKSVESRLSHGEDADVLIMAGHGMDEVASRQMILAGSRVESARAPAGLAMKKGAPKPDISTPDKLRDVLLSASSVGYSISASGQYVSGELFDKLRIKDKMQGKARQVKGLIPVAETVANGENQYGFQAVSEIMPVEGAELVERLPAEVEFITPVSAAVAHNSRNPGAARALLAFLTRPAMAEVLERHGLEPAKSR